MDVSNPEVPLDPPPATLSAWLEAACEHVLALVAGLEAAHANGPGPVETTRALAELDPTPREAPRPLAEALAWLDRAGRLGLQTNGPGYLAYVPGGGLPASAIAALVGLVWNRFTALANASPALARLEHALVDFLAAEVGYAPERAAGVLTSGGSLANLSAIVTARVALLGEDGDLREATIYTSREAHRSVMKAVRLAGIPPRNVRELPTDPGLRLDPVAVEAAVAADRAAGRRPFLIVASAGTTNVGAIDPLAELAAIARRHGLWLHVDAAYGGAFVLCDEGRAKLAGIGLADSVALDPHKGFFLPYGTGCLLVADGAALKAAHAEAASYLQDLAADTPTRSASEHGPELSRNDRALLLWLPFWLHGVGAFREALAEKLALARSLRAGLDALGIEVALEPELSIVAFRLPRSDGEAIEAWNARNRAFLEAINARGRVCLSSTLLPSAHGPAFTLRACVLSFRTHADRIAMALEDIAASRG